MLRVIYLSPPRTGYAMPAPLAPRRRTGSLISVGLAGEHCTSMCESVRSRRGTARDRGSCGSKTEGATAPQRPAQSDTEAPHHRRGRPGRVRPPILLFSSDLRLPLVTELRPSRGNAATRRVRSLLGSWSSALDDAPSARVARALQSVDSVNLLVSKMTREDREEF